MQENFPQHFPLSNQSELAAHSDCSRYRYRSFDQLPLKVATGDAFFDTPPSMNEDRLIKLLHSIMAGR